MDMSLANRLGLDTYEHRRMIDFLEDLQKAGHLKSGPELPLERMGSREFIKTLLENIACARNRRPPDRGMCPAADQFKDG